MTVKLQVVPASSTLGTSGGQEASTGYSVFLSKDQFDTALYSLQPFQEQIGVFSSEIHFIIVTEVVLVLVPIVR